MMFAYINLFKPKSKTIKITNNLLKFLEFPGWGDPVKHIQFSPLDVIKNPTKKMYKSNAKRIEAADLSYPIIMVGKNLADGVHRLAKAHLAGKTTIKAYVFPPKIMEKFLINKDGDWETVNKLQAYDYIQLFYERFCVN